MEKVILEIVEVQLVTAVYTYELDVPKSEVSNIMTELSGDGDPYDIAEDYMHEMVSEKVLYVENDERWTENFYVKK